MKAIEEIAKVICFRKENEKKAVYFLFKKSLISQNMRLKNLLSIVGNDFFEIKNEAEKVKNFLDGELFNLTKVMPILSINKKDIIINSLLRSFYIKKSYSTFRVFTK